MPARYYTSWQLNRLLLLLRLRNRANSAEEAHACSHTRRVSVAVAGEDVYYARANKGLASVGAQIAQGGGLFRQEESHSLCGIRVGTMTIDFGMPPQLTFTNVKNLPKTQVTHKIWNFYSVPVLSERKAGYVRNVIMWQRDKQKI